MALTCLLMLIVLSFASASSQNITLPKYKLIKIYDDGPLARSLYVQLTKAGYKAILIDPKTGLVEYGIMKKINSQISVSSTFLESIADLRSRLAHELADIISTNSYDPELVMDLVRIIRGDPPKKLSRVISLEEVDSATAYLALKELEVTNNRDPDVFVMKGLAINLRNSYASMEHWLVNLRQFDADADKIADELETFLETKTMIIKRNPDYLYLKLPNGTVVPLPLNDGYETVVEYSDTDYISVNVGAADRDLDSAINAFLSLGGSISAVYPSVSAFSGYIQINKIRELANMPEIGFVELSHTDVATYMRWSVAAMRVGTSWHKLLKPDEYPYYSTTPWALGYTGDPYTTIAIVDTGIDDSHFLTGPYGELDWTKKIIHWEDFTPDNDVSPEDVNGHGTHCASIAAGINSTDDYIEWETIYRQTDYSFTTSKSYTIDISEPGWYAIIGFDYITQSGGWSSPTADITITVYDPSNQQLNTSTQIYSGSSSSVAYEIERAVFYASVAGTYTVSVDNNNQAGFLGSLQYQILMLTLDKQYPYGGAGSTPGAHAGVAPDAKLMGIRIMSGESGSSSDLYAPIQWQIDNGATYHEVVSSNSWGLIDNNDNPSTDATMDSLFNQLVLSGIVAVVAAGNDGYNPPGTGLSSPAQADLVITVAAVNDFLNISSYSSAGDSTTGNTTKPDVAAVGGAGYYNGKYIDPEDADADGSSGSVAAADSNDADNSPAAANSEIIGEETSTLNNFWDIQGTSMATPHVSGIAALVIDAMGGWNSWVYDSTYSLKVKMIILMTAVKWRGVEDDSSYPLPYDPRTYPKDNITGYGVVQADAAIMAVTNVLEPGNVYTYSLGSSSTDLRYQVAAPKVWAGRIHLEAGTTYRFDLDVPTTGDFDLYIYDGNPDEYGQPVVIAKSENGYGQDESVEFTPSQTGDYYVVVKWYDPRYYGYSLWDNYGEFKLTIREMTSPSVQITNPTNNSYINSKTFNLVWQATDNFRLSKYEVWVGTQLLDVVYSTGTQSETPSYTVTVSADGSYTLKVVAYDTSNNTDESFVTIVVDTTPPDVSITSPANYSTFPEGSDVTMQWTGSDANGIDHYEVSLDGGAWIDVGTSTSYTWTAPAAGNHEFRVKAIDPAGNENISVVYFTIASEVSVVITSPSNGTYFDTDSVTITWSGTGSISYYLISLDGGAWIDVGTSTSYTFTGVSDGYHNVTVKAVGTTNEDTSFVEFYVDTTAPSVSITSPTDGSFVGGLVVVEYSGSDTYLKNVSLLVDGSIVDTQLSSGSFTFNWDTTLESDGSHTLTVIAYDLAGNSASTSVTVTVDNTAPSVSITAPENESFVSGVVTIEFSALDTNFKNVSLYIDSILVYSDSTSGAQSYSWDTTSNTDGDHVIRVVAYDLAGNFAEELIVVTTDNTAPSVGISSPTDGSYVKEIVQVVLNASDTYFKNVSLLIDGTTVQTWFASGTQYYDWDTTVESDGSHTLTVIAYDLAGNSASTSVTVTVDNTAPSVSITSPTEGEVFYSNTGSVDVSWSATDNENVAKVELYVDGSLEASFVPSNMTDSYTIIVFNGTHTVLVRAFDSAGNVNSDSVTFDMFYDTTPPSVSFTSPDNDSFTSALEVTFTWSVSDDVALESLELYDNDVLVASFTETIPDSYMLTLSEGDHTVEVIARDKAGNSASDSLVIHVDPIAPSVEITYPINGSSVGSSFTMRWTLSDNYDIATVEVYLNNSLVATYDGSVIEHTFENLTEAVYNVSVVAYDLAGNKNTSLVVFTVIQLSIIINSPEYCSYTNVSWVVVTWSVKGNIDNISVYLNDNLLATVDATVDTYNVTGLTAGTNVIEVHAVDKDGNVVYDRVEVIYDNVAPTVNIVSPTDGEMLNISTFTVSWSADDNNVLAGFKLFVNDTLVYEGTDNEFTVNVSSEGTFVLRVYAFDKAGNGAYSEISVRVETVLSVEIISPTDSSIFNTNEISIELSIVSSDLVTSVKVFANDALKFASSSEISVVEITLSDGEYEIRVTVTNAVGRIVEDTISVLVDTVAPNVDILTPSDGVYLSSSTFDVEWSATDQNAIVKYDVYLDNKFITTTTDKSIKFTGVSEGVHNITVIAVDVAGNKGKDYVIITIDLTPPEVIGVNPENMTYFNVREISVTLSVKENMEMDRVEVYIGGKLITVSADLTFTVLIGEDEGYYLIVFKVFDKAGNYDTVKVIVVLDLTSPIIRLIAPTNNSVMTNKNITISWDASDNYGIDHFEIKINNGSWVNIGKNKVVSVELNDGQNVIAIKALDFAGNEKIVRLVVIYQGTQGGEGEGIESAIDEFMILVIVILTLVSAIGVITFFVRKRTVKAKLRKIKRRIKI